MQHLDRDSSTQIVIEALPDFGHSATAYALAKLVAIVETTVRHQMVVGVRSSHSDETLVLDTGQQGSRTRRVGETDTAEAMFSP